MTCAWTYLTIKDVLLSAWPEQEPILKVKDGTQAHGNSPCFDIKASTEFVYTSNRLASTKVTVARRAGSLTLRSSGAETSDLTAVFSRCSVFEIKMCFHVKSILNLYTLYSVSSSFHPLMAKLHMKWKLPKHR